MPENTMQQEMIDLLRRELPAVDAPYLKRVAAVILGEQIDCSIDALATGLFKSNVAVGKILAALLRCEWLSVQHLIAHADPDHMHRQVQQFSDCIEHFNGLQEAVVNAADRSWRQTIDRERQGRILAECKSGWQEKGIVHLHNYFNEMPVTAKVKFIGLSGANLAVGVSPELSRVFVASKDMRHAIATSPDEKYAIGLGVVNCSAKTLNLVAQRIDTAMAELRQQVRVALEEGISIDISCHGQSVRAQIRDISASGLGVLTTNNGLSEMTPGETVGCNWKFGDDKVFVESIVRWRFDSGDASGTGREGLGFISLGPFSDLIHKFVLTRQQQLISILRKLPSPTWM